MLYERFLIENWIYYTKRKENFVFLLSLLSRIGIKQKLEKMMGVPIDVIRKTEYMRPRFKARIEKEVIYV